MILGIFLSSGDSFTGMAKVGQDVRFKNFYLSKFAQNFSKVYVFSYANEKVNDLPSNVFVVPNKYNIHRFLYGLIMPILNYSIVKNCHVFRAYHLLGTLPAIVNRVVFSKPFVFNYGYDYGEFAVVEGKKMQYIFINMISPIACFFASKIIAVTKLVYQWTPKEKTIFIPNGVDTKVFKPKKRKGRKKKLLVLNIGRLETQKNQLNLIKALRGLNVDLLIIGRGFLEGKLKKEAEKNKVNLKIIERVDNDKLPAIYQQADIFALPSITEGPVKVLLEAMSMGLAVVGSDVHGINEVIIDNQNGLLCQITPKSIREKLIMFINDSKLRENLGRGARSYILANHQLDQLLTKEINLLQQVARQK